MAEIRIDAVAKRLASVFIDAASLQKDTEFVEQLVQTLRPSGYERLPIESAMFFVGQGPPVRPIAVLNSADGTRQVKVDSQRVDFTFLGGDQNAPYTPTNEQFVAEAVAVIGAVLPLTGRSGHRLALVNDELATDRVERAAQPADLGSRFLILPNGANTHVREWTWKVLEPISADDDEYNVISEVTHVIGSFGPDTRDFEGLKILTDVNTVATRTRPRFVASQLQDSFAVLLRLTRDASARLAGMSGDY